MQEETIKQYEIDAYINCFYNNGIMQFNEFKQYCLLKVNDIDLTEEPFLIVLISSIKNLLEVTNDASSNRQKHAVISEVLNDFYQLGVNIKDELNLKEIVY